MFPQVPWDPDHCFSPGVAGDFAAELPAEGASCERGIPGEGRAQISRCRAESVIRQILRFWIVHDFPNLMILYVYDDDDGLASPFFLGHIEIQLLCLLWESVKALRKLDMLRRSSSNFGNAGAVENLLKSAMLLGQVVEVPTDPQMASPLLWVWQSWACSCNSLPFTIDVIGVKRGWNHLSSNAWCCALLCPRSGLPCRDRPHLLEMTDAS